MKNRTVQRLRAGIIFYYYDKQLFQSKMGKLGTLLKIPESKLRKQSLVIARGHKEKSKTK